VNVSGQFAETRSRKADRVIIVGDESAQSNFDLGDLARPGHVLLGKYRIERVLGAGGMGAVVLATHLQLEERVAIKFLLSSVARQPDMVERFLREGRTAIKIRSEHCVRVLDVGTLDGGQPYMVMEYMEGRDLEATIREIGPLPIEDAVDFVLQAGEALAEAHALGTVHRDIKPANLFVTRRADGSASVKVLDFGISKAAGPAGNMGMTSTQAVMGSPLYMSPEQMRSSKDVDARSDIWALGTVLYEALVGAPPFDGDTVTALIIKITQDAAPPLRPRRLDVPPQLEAAIMCALEKDRARRFQSMADFASALAPFGSASAASSADRIARVLGAPRPRQPSSANLAGFAASSPAVAAAQTQGAHAVTGARTASGGSRAPLIAGIFVATLVAGGLTAAALVRRAPALPNAAAPLSVTPPSRETANAAPALPNGAPALPNGALPVAPPSGAAVLNDLPPESVPATASARPADGPAAGAHPSPAGPSKSHGASPPAHPAPASPSPATPKAPSQSKDVFDDRKG
jgi:eukaryotic-like serine/threonine-protein kinase